MATTNDPNEILTTPIYVGPTDVEAMLATNPLARYPVESLRLLGIMTRLAEPKAIFMPPDGHGRAVFARIDDRVGPNGSGRISDIQPNVVIISYEGFAVDTNEQPREYRLELREADEDIPEDAIQPY